MNLTLIVFLILFLAKFSVARLNKPFDKIVVLLVNPQYTFFEIGSNPIPGANSTHFIDFTIKLDEIGYPIIVCQKSFPSDFVSFWKWPSHALKDSRWNKNGEYEGDDILQPISKMANYIQQNKEPDIYIYSSFDKNRNLLNYLNNNNYITLIVFGEAGNYHVKQTIIDALIEGFNVILVSDMTHYIPDIIEIKEKTLEEIEKYAINTYFKEITSEDFLKNPRKAISFQNHVKYYDNKKQYFRKCIV